LWVLFVVCLRYLAVISGDHRVVLRLRCACVVLILFLAVVIVVGLGAGLLVAVYQTTQLLAGYNAMRFADIGVGLCICLVVCRIFQWRLSLKCVRHLAVRLFGSICDLMRYLRVARGYHCFAVRVVDLGYFCLKRRRGFALVWLHAAVLLLISLLLYGSFLTVLPPRFSLTSFCGFTPTFAFSRRITEVPYQAPQPCYCALSLAGVLGGCHCAGYRLSRGASVYSEWAELRYHFCAQVSCAVVVWTNAAAYQQYSRFGVVAYFVFVALVDEMAAS